MTLSDKQIKALKADQRARKVSDSGGLHVYLTPTGSKLFRLAYRHGGKQKLLSFGACPVVSLAEARAKRDAAKALLAAGLDPSEHIKSEHLAKATAREATFDALADELLAKAEREGLAPPTIAKKRWLLSLARPDLGRRPIAEITAAEVLVPAAPGRSARNIRDRQAPPRRRLAVFRLAIATDRAETDPTYGLRGALTTPRVTHRAALTSLEAFAGLLRAIEGVSRGCRHAGGAPVHGAPLPAPR